jgi:hypothetical protein
LAVSYSSANFPTGLHNIRIHLNLNNPQEAYNERLNLKRNPNVYFTLHSNQEKRLETRIDGYLVQASVFPSGKVVISIPCSKKPFPITMHSPLQTTSDFTSLIAEIRRFLVQCLLDFNGRLVPPIHAPTWRLVHADINWDVPSTALNFLTMNDIQITLLDNVILRIYRKKLDDAKTYIRVEGTHSFGNAPVGTDEIGPIIVTAAEELAQRLAMKKEKERPLAMVYNNKCAACGQEIDESPTIRKYQPLSCYHPILGKLNGIICSRCLNWSYDVGSHLYHQEDDAPHYHRKPLKLKDGRYLTSDGKSFHYDNSWFFLEEEGVESQ